MNVVRGSCGRCSERRCSAATTLLKRPADAALSQGIWAVLAVFLLIYIVKSNERFSARQEEREKQYQELLLALTEKFNVLSVIERDITEVKEYIMADTKEINKKIGSIIFFVGLTLPRYRFSKPSASLDMNLR